MKILKLLLVFFILCGCSNGVNKNIQNNIYSSNIYDDKTIVYKKTDNYVTEEKTNIEKFEEENKSIENRNEILNKKLTELKDIEIANVEIIGNVAVVSIKVSGDLNDKKLFNFKKDIEKKVKELDKEIDHVSVNAKEELFSTILEDK